MLRLARRAVGKIDRMGKRGATLITLEETLAMATTLACLAGGAAPQVAATGMQNLITTMTAGATATDAQREVFQNLGLDAEEMAERMQVDAQGAIYDVMTALADLPEYTQIAALTQIFGRESADAIAPLLANLGLLDQAFGLVADPAEYAGSMQEEFRVQTETTANALRITMNFVRAMSIAVGSILLPELNALFKITQPIITSITDWAAAHPELIQLIARTVLGLLAFRAASIALRWGLLSALVPVLQLIRGGSWMIAMLPRLSAALLALLNPLAWVRGAVWAIRTAFIASGIGLLLAGIAAAGLWIYNNWSGLKVFFVNLWTAFRDALGPAAPILDGIVELVQTLWNWIKDLLGPLDATEAEWAAWGTSVGAVLGEATAAVIRWISDSQGMVGTILKVMAVWIALRTIWRFPMAPFRLVAKIIGFLLVGPLRLLLRAIGGLGTAFLGFGTTAGTALGGAVAASELAVTRMNRSFSRLRLNTFLAGIQGAVLLSQVPDEWEEQNDWRARNAENMEGTFRSLPGISQLMSAYEGVFERIYGAPPPTLAETDQRNSVESLTGAAARAQNQITDLERQREVLQGQIAQMQSIAAERGMENDATYLASIGALREELALIETDLDATRAQAAETQAALQAVGEADVRPVVNGEYIERALEAAQALDRTLEGLPQETGSTPQSGHPGRDAGGPVRAGMPYLVGERGREMFIPGVSGSIVPTRVIRAAMAAAALSAPVAAAADTGFLETQLDRRPALSAPAQQSVSTTIEVGQIVINAAPGMDPAAIGREVRRQLQALQDDRRGDLHDGVDF